MKFNFKTKLMMYMFVIGLVPMSIAIFIGYIVAKIEITEQANSRAAMVGSAKANLINSYFEQEFLSLKDLAASAVAQSALKDFTLGMNAYQNMELKSDEKAKVESFYKDTFGKAYSEKNSGATFDSAPVLASLDQITMQAQYDFLANNLNPLGEKNNLDRATRNVAYNDFHAVYHPEFNAFLKRHKLYDIFIVNPEGRVVYTVFKEADFSTNIATGPLASSGLGRAFEQSKKLKVGEVEVEDFAPYAPSYELPASFASTPIFISGQYKGSLIIQLPIDLISSIASSRTGLGEKGQSLLLGSDGRLRADAFRDKEHYSAVESFKKGSTLTIKTKAAEEAISGKTGVVLQNSYDGLETLAYYQPIKIGNLTWSIVTELSTDEVLQGLQTIKLYQFILFGVSAAIIGLVSWLLGVNFASRLQSVIDSISKSSKEVSAASKNSESTASELSTASTQQAASLQETMASLEEISAMVAQNADSAGKARVEVDKNAKSTEDGSRNVGEMIHAIDEIKATNEEILAQMETSNKEFGAIVQIISEIGNKTKVINDIVFQTKLLSFNASVEAARAGEHGKGFAVVAEEVGNLAQMSGNAAKEITDMLSNSIKRVNGIVDETKRKVDQLVEVGRDKVTYGQSVADKCRTALVEISSSSKSLTAMISEIAQASKEQAQGVQEINTAIAQLDQVTQKNATVSQQSSSQAQNLLGQTGALQLALGELVSFVEGSDAKVQQSSKVSEKSAPSNAVSMQGRQPKANAKAETKNKAPGKIVEYRKPTKNESPKKIESSNSTKSVSGKVAAGSDIVPGNNNPSFEDF